MKTQTPAFRTWHVVISGFLQDEGKPTGMVRLWRYLSAEHSGPEVRVELRSWNDNWRQLAELIHRVRPRRDEVAVKIYAYSWGAGFGAMELARQLGRRGLCVEQMVLSDPVYRSRSLPLRWLAMLPVNAISVPDNVRRVAWFRQRRNRPAGHQLAAENPDKTTIEPAVWADSVHQYMDDLQAFHLECERVARS